MKICAMLACLQNLTLIIDVFIFLILKAHLHATDFIVQFTVIKIQVQI